MTAFLTGVVMEILFLSTIAQLCSEIVNVEECVVSSEHCSWVEIGTNITCDGSGTLQPATCECMANRTPSPTISTLTPSCVLPPTSYELDLAVLVDISCPITTEQCKIQQKEIAETITSIRGTQTTIVDGVVLNSVRVSYIEYSSYNASLIVDIVHDPINENVTDPAASQMELYYTIRDSRACDYLNTTYVQRIGAPMLDLAVRQALVQLEERTDYSNGTTLITDRKMLIVSNCEVNNTEINKICEQFESVSNDQDVNVVMINNVYSESESFVEPEKYILCAVEWDENRIFSNTISGNYYEDVLPLVQNEVCELPTPAPTVNPTSDPTTDPTTYPTSDPTSRPTDYPTNEPTNSPTTVPSSDPTKYPTSDPSLNPTTDPTTKPTDFPSWYPTTEPTPEPTLVGFHAPTRAPHKGESGDDAPITVPTVAPFITRNVTMSPTLHPTEIVWPNMTNTNFLKINIPSPTTQALVPPIIWIWILIVTLFCCYCAGVIIYVLSEKKKHDDGFYAPPVRRDESPVSDVGDDEMEELNAMMDDVL